MKVPMKEHQKDLEEECPECQTKENYLWYKDFLTILLLILACLGASYFFLPFLGKFWLNFFGYLKMAWWGIALGMIIAGIIGYFVSEEFISYYLGQKKISTIFLAALLGLLFSACSHGLLFIGLSFYRKGASPAAVVTFLLASPWANLAQTFILIALFGWKSFIIIGAALVVAIISGLIFQALSFLTEPTLRLVGDNQNKKFFKSLPKIRFWDHLKATLQNSWSLSRMVLPWILLGFSLASFLGAYVPAQFLHHYFGPNLLGLFLTLIAATIIEICSEGTAPVAFELLRQTGAFGNAFVFLMAGVITDYTEIGSIWRVIGKKTALLLPLVTIPQVLAWGYLFNLLIK